MAKRKKNPTDLMVIVAVLHIGGNVHLRRLAAVLAPPCAAYPQKRVLPNKVEPVSARTVVQSAKAGMTTDLALQALLMAVWRRKPAGQVTVHSDRAPSSPAANGNLSSASMDSNQA